MASSRGQAQEVLRASRCVLPLAVMACCVLWTLLVLTPLSPELAARGGRGSFQASVGGIVGTVERWSLDTPPAPSGSEEIDGMVAAVGREQIIDIMSLPPSKQRQATSETPPPPARENIIDESRLPPPPPPGREHIDDVPLTQQLDREGVIEVSSSPPEPQTNPDPPPPSPPPPPPPPPPPEPQIITEPPPSPPPPHQPRHHHQTSSSAKIPNPTTATPNRCAGRYIHVAAIPPRFNAALLRACRTLSSWTDMCKHVANAGMGPRLTRSGGALPSTGWFDTNQFTLEIIFHHRIMNQYPCLTADPAQADAVFVPYYAGLDVGRYLWGPFGNEQRDALAVDLVNWLRSTPAWARHGGRDHFFVGGRIAWDFMREEGGEWGSRLLLMPEARNMTALVLESADGVGVGVPYPTSFHPSRLAEVAAWQRSVRRARRPWLLAFAGAPRPGNGTATLRDALIAQCARSRRCKLLQCGVHGGRRPRDNDCHAPGTVMRLFKSAAFCLQPPGDSYTRRSTFDAVVAGCVPVFFHPSSAHAQYAWHLPGDHAKYSVLVPGDGVRNGSVRMEDVLRRFTHAKVAVMRDRVVRLIPRVVYRDPRARGGDNGFRDAVDVAVDGVMERVHRITSR